MTPILSADGASIVRAIGRSKHDVELTLIAKVVTARRQFKEQTFSLEHGMNHAVDRLATQNLLPPVRKLHGPDHVGADDLLPPKSEDGWALA